MGRVFSAEEVSLGEVPTRDEVSEAAVRFMDHVRGRMAQSAILGCMLFGSVPAGEHTRRSDVDIVAMYSTRLPDLAQRELMQAAALAQPDSGARVEIAPIVYTQDQAVHGRHTIDRLFAQHLLAVRGDQVVVMGQNPAQSLHFADRNPHQILEKFLVNKMQKLVRAQIVNDPRDVKDLRRALEVPAAVGRRLASCMVLSGKAANAPMPTDRNLLAQWLEDSVPLAAKSQASLRSLDIQYSDLLDAAVSSGDTSDYDSAVADIRRAALPKAEQLTRLVGASALGW